MLLEKESDIATIMETKKKHKWAVDLDKHIVISRMPQNERVKTEKQRGKVYSYSFTATIRCKIDKDYIFNSDGGVDPKKETGNRYVLQ